MLCDSWDRIMKDSDITPADKGGVVCRESHRSASRSLALPCYPGLLDRNVENTLEYQWAEVSPVSSHLWPRNWLTLYQGVSWRWLWKRDPDLNQLNHWIGVHREGDRKPCGSQKHVNFWHKSYVTWQKPPKEIEDTNVATFSNQFSSEFEFSLHLNAPHLCHRRAARRKGGKARWMWRTHINKSGNWGAKKCK